MSDATSPSPAHGMPSSTAVATTSVVARWATPETRSVELSQAAGGVTVRLHDLNAARLRNQQSVSLPPGADFRLD